MDRKCQSLSAYYYCRAHAFCGACRVFTRFSFRTHPASCVLVIPRASADPTRISSYKSANKKMYALYVARGRNGRRTFTASFDSKSTRRLQPNVRPNGYHWHKRA